MRTRHLDRPFQSRALQLVRVVELQADGDTTARVDAVERQDVVQEHRRVLLVPFAAGDRTAQEHRHSGLEQIAVA